MRKIYEPAEIIVMIIDAKDAIVTSGTFDVTDKDLEWEK